MIINIEISPKDIYSEFDSQEEAIEFIMGIDGCYAEVSFTEKVIQFLIKSLKSDLTNDEIRSIVDEVLI